MNKIILLFLLSVSTTNFCFSQTTKDKICGKTWFPDKYKETGGKIYPLDKETKLLFTKFNCDGTYESWEDKGLLIKGTWIFDKKTNSIMLESKNSKIKMDERVQVLSCDGKKLAFVKTDGGGGKITIYSITK